MSFNGTSVVDPEGVIYISATAVEEDPNGNKITQSSTVLTDSRGRQINLPPTAGTTSNTDTSTCPQPPQVLLAVDHAVLWTPPGPNGASPPYKFCYALVPMFIPPGGATQPAWGPGTQTKLQSIVLPNGQTWNFAYNDPGDGSTYGGNTINYGTLTEITLPTGGTISYTYEAAGGFTFCQNTGRWVATRTVN